MPIGFKNRTDGNVQVAVDAVRAAAASHAFAGIDDAGMPAILHTTGNPDCHVILRGGHGRPELRRAPSVEDALVMLGAAGLPERLVIDASHDNSGKDPEQPDRRRRRDRRPDRRRQRGDRRGDARVLPGRGRPEPGAGEELTYGQSITDACIDWEDTVSVARAVSREARSRARRGPMRIAVLGVGLIGGSIGLAATAAARAPRSSAASPTRRRLERAVELGADRPRRRLGRRGLRGRRARLLRGAGRRRCPSWRARRSRPAARDASSPTSARPSARSSPRSATTSASSAATRWPGPRPPGSTTPATTSSRAPAGT